LAGAGGVASFCPQAVSTNTDNARTRIFGFMLFKLHAKKGGEIKDHSAQTQAGDAFYPDFFINV
jgi:hypothetical protein